MEELTLQFRRIFHGVQEILKRSRSVIDRLKVKLEKAVVSTNEQHEDQFEDLSTKIISNVKFSNTITTETLMPKCACMKREFVIPYVLEGKKDKMSGIVIDQCNGQRMTRIFGGVAPADVIKFGCHFSGYGKTCFVYYHIINNRFDNTSFLFEREVAA